MRKKFNTEKYEEGLDFSKNLIKNPSHSTFGELALGPLTDEFFGEHQQETFKRSTGFRCTDGDFIPINDIPQMEI